MGARPQDLGPKYSWAGLDASPAVAPGARLTKFDFQEIPITKKSSRRRAASSNPFTSSRLLHRPRASSNASRTSRRRIIPSQAATTRKTFGNSQGVPLTPQSNHTR